MRRIGGGRFGSRCRHAGAIATFVASSLSAPSVAKAVDPPSAMSELSFSPDFRVRVSAALFIGRTRPPGACDALSRALGDSHPAVRIAAGEALGALGDRSALPALKRLELSESSDAVRAQIGVAIATLRETPPPHADADPAALAPNVRYVVAMGVMRNGSGQRGDDLCRVLLGAARARARALRGAVVVDNDAPLLKLAAAKHVPIVTIDGTISQIVESHAQHRVVVHARVEFTVRRNQALWATLSGTASSTNSDGALADEARQRMQDDAIDGAVQSALQGAEQGLIVAAR